MHSNSLPDLSHKKTLLWLVAVGFFMETLDATIVNTALPTMARLMKVHPLTMQSVVISYTLTLAMLIPASAWLIEKYGTKKVYFTAIAVFTSGSLCCALSETLPLLVLSRVLQGIGGSMLIPVGRLAILRAFPGREYISALSFVAVPALLGPLLGPTIGGWLVEYFSWHWIFLINIPIGVFGCLVTLNTMSDDVSENPKKFDLVGFLQLSLFMLATIVAMEGVVEFNFSRGSTIILFSLGLSSLCAYFFHAQKVEHPLLSLSVFRIKTFHLGILGNIFSRLGSGGLPFLIPLFLQLCLGYSPFEAGFTKLPLAMAAMFSKKFITPIILKVGHRKFLIINTLLVGAGISSFALIDADLPNWMRILLLFCFGSVNSMQFTAMNTLTMKDLKASNSSNGNTIFSMVQMLAMSFSVGAAGSILGTFLEEYDKLKAFHSTFIAMGLLTTSSAIIFWQLKNSDDFT